MSFEENPHSLQVELPPHSSTQIKWTIRADRPQEVNLGQPWPVCALAKADGSEESYTFRVSIPDPRPARVYYLLTEDCETFDGGSRTGDYGASSCLGNANDFMDPEDYRIQMIDKPNRMNEIAEKHGACWTHFWCVPQRFAVDWASARSSTGAWPRLAEELDRSVRDGSVRHEYAPHIHFDYEPESRLPPQPRLVYDEATDGILPHDYYDPVTNPRHHFHDWDGSGRGIAYVKTLGDLADVDSKAGSLRKSLAYLARMQMNRRYPIVARTGGFDFGIAAADQLISTAAYEANGLRANSDARFPESGPSCPKLAYWCDPQDRMRGVETLGAARLLQLGVTHETDFSDVSRDNLWFTSAMSKSTAPGVHLLTALTHAMFMRGTPDPFRSLEGGSFEGIDQHLSWIRSNYPHVRFATTTEAVLEFIDYYTPRVEAYVCATLCGGVPREGLYEYEIRLLGEGIRIDEERPATVTVLAPPVFDSSDIDCLQVSTNGQVLAEQGEFSSKHRPMLTVTLMSRPVDLRLRVLIAPPARTRVAELLTEVRYANTAETSRAPLLRLRSPTISHAPADVMRLLMNPVAGSAEPLGRRIHPWGVFLMGAALTGAMRSAEKHQVPQRLRLRWRKAVSADADVHIVGSVVDSSTYRFKLFDPRGDLLADGEAELRCPEIPAADARVEETPVPDHPDRSMTLWKRLWNRLAIRT